MDITLILVTLVSLTLAAVMTTLAWRLAREERRRSDARVAALAAEIRDHDLPLRNAPTAPMMMSGDLFGAAQPAQARSRFAAIVAVGVIVVGSAVATVMLLSESTSLKSGSSRTPQTAAAPATAHPAAAAAPLELLALTHEREADRLTVRGVVRNPSSGAGVARLTAVVFLFNRDGGFVASGRAGVDALELEPGTETPFAVTIPGAGDVGRYRVSFRTDDRVVPHVDRRDRAMAQAR
jgi:flagellar basal body-associated protein FliL